MRKLLVLFVILAGALWAQPQQQVGIWPDCVQFYHFTAAAQVTPDYNNRQLGCTDWVVTYTASGFGALTLITQSANDAAGAPGAWGNYAGAVVSGVNPNIAITYATTVLSGYQSWMRMRLNAVVGAGNVWGVIYGWKTKPVTISLVAAIVNGPAAAGAPPGGNPVLVAGWDKTNVQLLHVSAAYGQQVAGAGSGVIASGNIYPITACDSHAVITVAGGNTTALVTAAAGRLVRVCSFSISADAGGGTAQFIEGTHVKTDCDTNPVNVTGNYNLAATTPVTQGSGLGEIFQTTVAANQLCLAATVVTVTGVLSYATY